MKHPAFTEIMAHVLPLFLLLSLCCAGCSLKAPAPRLTSLTIAFQEWVGYGLFYLARDKGFCQEEGLDLVFINEQLDSSRRDAFKQGMLDCEAGTIDLLVSKAACDTPIAMVMNLGYSSGGDGIVAGENIKTLGALTGKTIAMAREDVGDTFLLQVCDQEGLAPADVTIVPTRPEKAAALFIAGGADACVTWEPHLSKALMKPGAHLLASTRDYPCIITDTLNVRKDLIERNPEDTKKLMRAWFKALAFYKAHPEQASEIIAPHYKLSAAEYRQQIGGMQWIGYEEQASPAKREKWMEIFNTVAGLKSANGRIPKKPEAQQFINHALLEKLYETGQ